MLCPVCKKQIKETDEICPNCQSNLKGYARRIEEEEKTNADYLRLFSKIDLIIFIIGAAITWGQCTDSKNILIPLAIGASILIVGFTLFFCLNTIADIYTKVSK